ncbi:hypothetical protein ACRALDRAFT_1093393 [Sodiomyces alcalophilus JCM 7366]|uniref:uncharacterized protein n=1 Tax=Sodiomyces alcalophilus JCM 7366 TaxID=591952 RepID=UPI0039B48671
MVYDESQTWRRNYLIWATPKPRSGFVMTQMKDLCGPWQFFSQRSIPSGSTTHYGQHAPELHYYCNVVNKTTLRGRSKVTSRHRQAITRVPHQIYAEVTFNGKPVIMDIFKPNHVQYYPHFPRTNHETPTEGFCCPHRSAESSACITNPFPSTPETMRFEKQPYHILTEPRPTTYDMRERNTAALPLNANTE